VVDEVRFKFCLFRMY